MKKLLFAMLMAGIPVSGNAQSRGGDGDRERVGFPRWGGGVATVVSDRPYAGEGTKLQPIPMVTFEGDRFYLRGITAGWRFVRKDSFEVAGIAKLRLDGFNVDDLGTVELAANGINRALLEDRDLAVDVGLGVTWRGVVGEIEMEFLTDATNRSGGQEITLQYGHPFNIGNGRLMPRIGIAWQSEKMANYYFGTFETEVQRGVVDYRPGSAVIPNAGLQYVRPLGKSWAFVAIAEYSVFPDELNESPLVDRDSDGSSSVLLGVSRSF